VHFTHSFYLVTDTGDILSTDGSDRILGVT